MTDEDRDRLRSIQDRFLALPRVRKVIPDGNGDMPICEDGSGPRYIDVRDQLHPAWEWWFERMIEDHEPVEPAPDTFA